MDRPSTLKLILTQSKNALVKQYQRLFEMEGVKLSVAAEALGAIARKAIDRKTGHTGCAPSWRPYFLTQCSTYPVPSLIAIETLGNAFSEECRFNEG
jgi:ATP-dependent Clp protease ATP-binding subunit ClpX